MTYKHWPLLLKTLSLPLALGLLALFAALYASAGMKSINARYTNIIENPEAAVLANARANRYLTAFGRDGFRLATATTSEGIQDANAAIADDKAKMDQQLEIAIKTDPGNAEEYRQLKTQAHAAMDGTCAEMISLAQSTDPAMIAKSTAAMNATCSPALVAASQALTDFNGKVIASLDKTAHDMGRETDNNRLMTLGVIIGGLVVILGIGFWLNVRGLVAPVKALIAAMNALSNGELGRTVPCQEQKDEIGAMARTTEAFRKKLEDAEQVRKDAEALKIRAEADRRQAMIALADQFESSVGAIVSQVSSAATEMQAAATQLTATAQETSAQSVAVSAAAEEAGANVTSVASSAEELGASVSEIGRQVETSADVAQTALNEAEAAAAIVAELTEVAASIGGVVDLIAGLAGQTNLLALNATIESARAGEAGKGFAVVASEVKALAAQTSRATTDISAKIARIQETTGRTVDAMRHISDTIQSINTSSSAIASAVEQQAAATQEIVQAVHQASAGTQEVTGNISGVAHAAEQTGEAAAQVLSASGELAQQAERLHYEMDKFLATVRAA